MSEARSVTSATATFIHQGNYLSKPGAQRQHHGTAKRLPQLWRNSTVDSRAPGRSSRRSRAMAADKPPTPCKTAPSCRASVDLGLWRDERHGNFAAGGERRASPIAREASVGRSRSAQVKWLLSGVLWCLPASRRRAPARMRYRGHFGRHYTRFRPPLEASVRVHRWPQQPLQAGGHEFESR
jgi:hypothetical protein